MNLDEEASNLIRYQQAYQAGTRIRWRTKFSTPYLWRQDDDWKNVFSADASGSLNVIFDAQARLQNPRSSSYGQKINSASDDPLHLLRLRPSGRSLTIGGNAEEREYAYDELQ